MVSEQRVRAVALALAHDPAKLRQGSIRFLCRVVGHEAFHHLTRRWVQAGADVDVRDDGGNTPLHVAASGGLCDTVTTLLAVRPTGP
jgi:hypothetical protein